jgi:ZIP family zinc transporter
MQSLSTVALYGLLATFSLTVGGVAAAYWQPGDKIRSHMQHVAAGFVFAAAAVEVLPDVMHRNEPFAAAIGFAAGLALTLAIRLTSEKLPGSGSNWSFVGVLVADLLVDGLLIGVAATAGERKTGLLVAIAVSVELLALGLSMGVTLSGASRFRVIGMTAALSLTPFAGALGGYFLGGILSSGWIEATLAFAVAVFLFMAAEELLREAHETRETPLGTSLFFLAFLCLLLLDMIGSG